MYIDDCTEGTIKLAHSDIIQPLNIGSDELVSINRLVDIVEKIAGLKLKRSYKLDAPKGVRGRNSDNTLLRKVLGWEPNTPLDKGLAITYKWIQGELKKKEVGELAEVNGD
jgi:nucleoside-diphosphate-sugar epimerase